MSDAATCRAAACRFPSRSRCPRGRQWVPGAEHAHGAGLRDHNHPACLSPRMDDARQVGALHMKPALHVPKHDAEGDPSMANRQLVLAFFPDEPAADNAAAALKDSGIAHGDAIGILALDSHGKLK
jgi:hypothetical protein